MDLNSPVIAPVVEPTGFSAWVAYVAGGVAGVAIALPVLIGIFSL